MIEAITGIATESVFAEENSIFDNRSRAFAPTCGWSQSQYLACCLLAAKKDSIVVCIAPALTLISRLHKRASCYGARASGSQEPLSFRFQRFAGLEAGNST
eukprot:m.637778 g.637778  ORF g.637778 m.637778 type:complete len:101 (-) comp58320_c2_seq7:617-919(-)